MGWLYTNRPGRLMTNQQFFEREYSPVLVIDEMKSNLGVIYAAAHRADDPTVVFALVILTHWRPRDQFNFGYKDMDETMGPAEDRCPASILDRLTPTDSKYAIEWRARCRANLDRPPVTKGAIVQFDTPFKFTDGGESDLFEHIERSTFYRLRRLDFKPESGAPWFRSIKVRITNWKDRPYQVINA